MSRLRAPRPNIGECIKTSSWDSKMDNRKMVNNCKKCVSKPGYYGEKQFYCNGKCMSQYTMNSVCSVAEPIAKNIQQCSKPCLQIRAPSLSNGCADNFDCKKNQVCKNGACVVQENFTIGIL